MTTLEQIINQVDAFIRKYYKNLMLKGFLLFCLIFIVSFFVVVGLEYIGRFNSGVRATLFFLFLALNAFVFYKYIAIPIAKLFSFGSRIDRYQAARIIGRFFPDVNDRLLNTLQLNDDLSLHQGNIELLKASVNQNAKRLSVFSFTTAVDYKENSRFLKYLIPVFLVFGLVFWLIPSFFTDGTERLVNYNREFIEEAPFNMVLMNDQLIIEEGQTVEVVLKVTPKENGSVPERFYVNSSEGRFLMQRINNNSFSYSFPKVKRSFTVKFQGNQFESEKYDFEVFQRTSMGKLQTVLSFPSYLNIPNQTIDNAGDLVVPEGTQIIWNGLTKNTAKVEVGVTDSLHSFNQSGFKYSYRFLESNKLQVLLFNKHSEKVDTVSYSIEVVKDAYPTIDVVAQPDSLDQNKVQLIGAASDDHGLRSVEFIYEIERKNGTVIRESKFLPAVSGTNTRINLLFDRSKLGLMLEDKLTYYFVVNDNDGVNGSKSTRSRVFEFKAPSSQEMNEKRRDEKDKAKENLKDLLRETKEFNERLDNLKMDLLNTANPSWKELQQLEQLREQKSSLQEKIDKLNNDLKNSFEEKNDFSPIDEDLLEQQRLLEELLNDVMDDDLQELLEKLQEMMEKQQFDQLQDLFEEAENKTQDSKEQLDRTMEMLKKMDVEERIDDLESDLQKLAEEQIELMEKMDNNEISKSDALEEQQQINEKFEEIQKDLDELLEKNEELKRPMDLDDLKEDRKEVQDQLQEAKENMEQGKDKKSKENQQKASDKMQEMSSKMNSMKSDSKQQQQKEDMAALRRLLENLLRLSFSQEQNMDDVASVDPSNPAFGAFGRNQRSIIDNTKPVEDSLRALADRLPKIASFVNKELGVINQNYRNMIDDIDERRKRQWLIKQQYVMTSLNNLALFLNESLQNMQSEMQGDMEGGGSCDNPGGKGKGSSGDELQNIKEMLKKQLEEMEKGNQPGGQKPGGQEGVKLPFGNKQAAQMAAQQSAMRKKLEEMRKELNKDGKGTGNELNDLLKELEEQEKNIINKRWDEEMINRQKEILTRLLESEKALEERGFDEQRESNVGKNEDFGNQIEFLEYKKQKEKQIELLRTLDPAFSKYYRSRATDYFNLIY